MVEVKRKDRERAFWFPQELLFCMLLLSQQFCPAIRGVVRVAYSKNFEVIGFQSDWE
jgi:hypothetical protein